MVSLKDFDSSQFRKVVDLLRARAYFQLDKEVTLASGEKSKTYVDCKQVTLAGDSLYKISRAMLTMLRHLDPNCRTVAGVSVGGDPLVAGLILTAHRDSKLDFRALIVRKEKKGHGASQGRAVEGLYSQDGARKLESVWLLEDVVSSGKSSLNAAQLLKEEGVEMAGVLCIVDREMGGVQSLESALNCKVVSLVKLSELEQISSVKKLS